jgi:hypothetical protein
MEIKETKENPNDLFERNINFIFIRFDNPEQVFQ